MPKIAVVAFNTAQVRPVANKKFDNLNEAIIYIRSLLYWHSVEFLSIRKVVEYEGERDTGRTPEKRSDIKVSPRPKARSPPKNVKKK